jgi:hypothetical protein
MQRNQAIVDDILARDIRQINPKRLTVILDSCYSGGMRKVLTTNNMVAKFIPNPFSNKQIKTAKKTNVKSTLFHEGAKGMYDGNRGTLYAASQEHQVAYEYNRVNLRGGIFTKSFAHALRQTKNLNRAFNIAKREVSRRTKGKQIPQRKHY